MEARVRRNAKRELFLFTSTWEKYNKLFYLTTTVDYMNSYTPYKVRKEPKHTAYTILITHDDDQSYETYTELMEQ